MRIVIVEPAPSFGGGLERFALDLGKALSARGHRVSLLYDEPGTMLSSYGAFAESCVQCSLAAFGWRTLGSSIVRAHRVGKVVREQLGADVVFSSHVQYVRFLALMSALSRVPVVLHLGLASPLSVRSQAIAFRALAAGVAPSAHTAETWRRDGWPSSTLHVVPNWVDHDVFHPATEPKAELRRTLGLPERGFMFGCVGRMREDKGTHVVLEAFATVAAREPSVTMVFVGSDEHDRTTRWEARATQLGIPRERVVFAGRRPNTAEYFRAMDAAVVPGAKQEAFGLVVLEAMATGVPPIVSALGVMPDLVGATEPDLIVPPGDATALANQMMTLIRSSDRLPALGCALRKRAATAYAADRAVKQYEEILSNVVRSPASSTRSP